MPKTPALSISESESKTTMKPKSDPLQPECADAPDFKVRRPPLAYRPFPRFVAPDFLTEEEQVNFYLPISGKGPTHGRQELACSLIRHIGGSNNRLVRGKDFKFEIDSSKPVFILCHGLSSWRNQSLLVFLAAHISRNLKCHTIRFDFTGNAHSTGKFRYTSYGGEVQDIDDVVQFVRESMGCKVISLLGHSKGSHAVMRYAWEHESDGERVPTFVNLAGRFGVPNEFKMKDHFTQLQLDTFEYKGKVKVGRLGHRDLVFSEEDHKERMALDSSASKDISGAVLTIHGGEDKELDISHAHKFDKVVPNHDLLIIEKADHNFNGLKYMDDMVDKIAVFIRKHAVSFLAI